MTTAVGFSEAAQTVYRVQEDEAKRREDTVTFSQHSLNDQLIDLAIDCGFDGWESEGSVAVDRRTLMVTKKLIESLPMVYRTPFISGEPDGSVDLEWYVHPRRILSVSVDANGILHWAALIGEEDPRGSCRFFDEPPKTLLYWIDRVCNG